MESYEKLEKQYKEIKEKQETEIGKKNTQILMKMMQEQQNELNVALYKLEALRDVIADALSIAEAKGADFDLEPWNSLQDALEKFTK